MLCILEFLLNIINLGLIYSLIVLGVHISSTILKFDDLTTEGSFAVGGSLAAVLAIHGCPSFVAVLCVLSVGAVVGALTGILHTKLRLNNLLCGLILTSALFSINLRLAGAHLVVPSEASLCTTNVFCNPLVASLPILALVSLVAMSLIAWFLRTEIGYVLKAVGGNVHMVRILGKNVDAYIIGGLALANALTALSGMLIVHYTGFFSITGNMGILIVAMAGLMIGKALCGSPMLGVMCGSLLYQFLLALTVELNVDPVWNKLITAVLMLLLVIRKNNVR